VSVPRRLHAPEENGSIVAIPPLDEVARLLEGNRRKLASPASDIMGRSWADLRQQARRAALATAQAYLAERGEPLPDYQPHSIVLAGHQPEIFHPGVWLKNFTLARLAKTHGLSPINLVVDNDTLKSAAIRLPIPPRQSDELPVLTHVPFDQWIGEIPYEERNVQDEDLWESFPQRAAEITRDWPFSPFLPQYWDEVNRHAKPSPLLGERLASGRRNIERKWGCHNFELPISALCRTESFAWFAAHLLTELQAFHSIYNDCVHDYRRQYGIRSRNHPVPDLAVDGDWLEAPLWAWRAGNKQRNRLFSRKRQDAIELRAGGETWPSLPAASGERMIREWLDLAESGYKIRSRALTNTLFARLFVGDLFIHGIGGGKYDELTDAIIRRFYRIEPPEYVVLSGTLQLPFTARKTTPKEVREQARQLRDLHWNPQRHLAYDGDGNSRLAELAGSKQTLIEFTPRTASERRQRFSELRRLTEALWPAVQDQIRDQADAVRESEQILATRTTLQRRDYAFCVYPESRLREFLAQA
jgi:hypothetical protein